MKRALNIILLFAVLLALTYALVACQREDGLPDPPLRTLVPCDADAGADEPLVCPPPEDAGTEDQATLD